MPTLVDFGHATFTHSSTSSWVSCSAFATTSGETEVIESKASVDAPLFSQQHYWARCRVPLSFNLSFCFAGLVRWSSNDYSNIKHEIINTIRSTTVRYTLCPCCGTESPSCGRTWACPLSMYIPETILRSQPLGHPESMFASIYHQRCGR